MIAKNSVNNAQKKFGQWLPVSYFWVTMPYFKIGGSQRMYPTGYPAFWVVTTHFVLQYTRRKNK